MSEERENAFNGRQELVGQDFPHTGVEGSPLRGVVEQGEMIPQENCGTGTTDGSCGGITESRRRGHETSPENGAGGIADAAAGSAGAGGSSVVVPAAPALTDVGSFGASERRSVVRGLGSDFAADTEQRWRELWSAWEELKAERPGIGRRAAAEVLGVGQVTLWRLERQYAKRGFRAEIENCGRNSQWEYLVGVTDGLTAFAAKLQEIYLATVGAGSSNMTRKRRTAKMATALTCMAEEPECPAELRALLRRGKFPICLRRFLRSVTPELENRFRGPKHFQLNGLTSRRDLTIRFEDGTRGELPAGFKWVFDDMSENRPFYALVGSRMLFSRQGLYSVDHRALKWLGKELVARPREAYRAEDILRFCRKLFERYGKPDMIVFERGVWHSRKIRGFKVTETQAIVEEEWERPEMAATERGMLQDGLEGIGVKVVWATSAHGKIIEGCFNHLQDVIAVMARDFVNVGRHAGEFEVAAKRVRQVRSGSRQPNELGFAPMLELSDRIDKAMAHINGKENSRGEVPDEVWARDVARRPLAAMEPDDYAAFLPELRERVIDGGRVTVQVNGEPQDFRAPWMAELGSGFKVYLKFDSSEPTLGGAVYNRECGPANVRGWKAGQFIGWAVWEMPAPAADVVGNVRGVERKSVEEFYGQGAFDNGDNLRRKQSKLVATAFSALPRPGQPAVKSSEARDGEGRVVRVESGPAASPETRPHQEARPYRSAFAAPSEEQVQRRRERLLRQADIARLVSSEPQQIEST